MVSKRRSPARCETRISSSTVARPQGVAAITVERVVPALLIELTVVRRDAHVCVALQ